MAIVLTNDEHYKNIADSIREKTGNENSLYPADMATEIPKVYDAGKQAEYDSFWKGYQITGITNNGDSSYDFAFAGKGWTKTRFKPKYDIKPKRAMSMFQYNYMGGDLAATLEGLGVVLDISSATIVQSIFHETMFTRLPKLDFAKAGTNTNNVVIYNCPNLVTIDEIVFYENNTFSTNTIRLCSKLKNLTISGTIANNGLYLSGCNALSHDSLMSIVNALKTFTDGSTHTITFGSTNLAKLTTEEKAIATQKGWTLT